MTTQLQFNVAGSPIRMLAQEFPTPGAAILLLHGSGGNLDFWTARLAPVLAGANIALYAPSYFDRTGTMRADLATITDGVHVPRWLEVVDHALNFVAGRPGVDPGRVVLAGVSLGGFLALATAAQLSASPKASERKRIRAVVEVSGGLAEPFAAQASPAFPPTLILHGGQDPIVPVSEAHSLDRRLTALDVAHRTEILPGEGHWFSPAALPRMLLAISGFLKEHLGMNAATQAPL